MTTARERLSRRPLDSVVLAILLVLICLASVWFINEEHGGAQGGRSFGSFGDDGSGNGGSGSGTAHEGGAGSIEAGESLSFTITGDAQGDISPGVMMPLDLTLENPHSQALSVKGLTVSVQELEAPNASASLPCTVDDFAVTQFSGPAAFVLAALETVSLAGLDIPTVQWPEVGMHNTAVNQDGCKGATVTLHYTASGTAVTS